MSELSEMYAANNVLRDTVARLTRERDEAREAAKFTCFHCGRHLPTEGHEDNCAYFLVVRDLEQAIADRDAARAELAERPVWKRREEHPDLFYDGDQYLVAVPTNKGIELDIITVRTDDDYFAVHDVYGEGWGWEWWDVEWWIKADDLRKPLKAAAAAAKGSDK